MSDKKNHGEKHATNDPHSQHKGHDASVDQPEVNPDTRNSAHDARKNVGNGSHDLDRAPIDNRDGNTPRPRPRDNV